MTEEGESSGDPRPGRRERSHRVGSHGSTIRGCSSRVILSTVRRMSEVLLLVSSSHVPTVLGVVECHPSDGVLFFSFVSFLFFPSCSSISLVMILDGE